MIPDVFPNFDFLEQELNMADFHNRNGNRSKLQTKTNKAILLLTTEFHFAKPKITSFNYTHLKNK